jgi:hypothetical protein
VNYCEEKRYLLIQALIEGEQSDDAGILDMQKIILEVKSELAIALVY